MTNREIAKYIRYLNQGTGKETIFIRSISKNVVISKVWSEKPKPSDEIIGNFAPYTIFFIKNDNEYIGAVVDMTRDLHWYVSPQFRKQGLLKDALKRTILPYLFYERDEQQISVDIHVVGEQNSAASIAVAKSLGFSQIESGHGKEVFTLHKERFDWSMEELDEKNTQIGAERIEFLKKKLFYVTNTLWMIQNELEMHYDNDGGLEDVVRSLRSQIWKTEDLMYRHER